MSIAALLHPVADVVVRLSEEAPEAEDVTAGWTAFVVFILLIGAVAVLGFSLTKHLRRAAAAEEAGLYGQDAVPGGAPADPIDDTGSGRSPR